MVDISEVSLHEFCSTHEAAGWLDVSVKTVQQWVESGVLKAWKTPGGHRRITTQSVVQLLRQRLQSTCESAPAPAPGRSPRSILVVDDDPNIRKLYQLNIEYWGLGLQIHTARDGFEGLTKLGEIRPDILLTDLNMPGMDGFAMIHALREADRFHSLRIIMISAMTEREMVDCGGLPPDIVSLPKPIPFDRLRNIVEGFIG